MRGRVVSLLIWALALLVPASAQASFPGESGKFAYLTPYGVACCGVPANQFETIDRDGVRAVVSTGWAYHPRHMAWSRDGQRIAFDARVGPTDDPDGPRALFVMNADGTGLRQVGRGDKLRSDPAWSPGGTRLVFVQDNGARGGSTDIYTIATSGGDLRRLTTASGLDDSPDWVADGTRIAYRCVARRIVEICQMRPSGAGKSVTTAGLNLSHKGAPSWSPDGSSIAFAARPAGEYAHQVHRISRSGGSPHKLTTDNDGSGAAWAPDGTRIAYHRWACQGPCWDISTVDAAGGGDVRFFGGGTEDGHLLDPNGWQPLR